MKIEAAEVALARSYDVVVVGAGIMGAIVARRLAENNRTVLLLDAGNGAGLNFGHYTNFLDTYYKSSIKIPQAPYPTNPDAPQPTELQTEITPPDQEPPDGYYFIQRGPLPYRSTYTRYVGGTTLHWLGTSLRMLPEDFKMQTLYGQAQDWPISYDLISEYYLQAERELGVSANVDEQSYHGQRYPHGYVYPMFGLPPSVVDQYLTGPLKGQYYDVGGQRHPLDVIGTPAARNGIANPAYDGGRGYQPVGSVSARAIGHRCMGNSSCVPICPIQAKYNAMKTLVASRGDWVTMVTQCVASRVVTDPDTGRVTEIEVKNYVRSDSPEHSVLRARGTMFVLCAAPVENSKLMLASAVGNSSGLVGVGLMDHPELLTWGRAAKPVWPMRGPIATSGIEGLRWGNFRSEKAAFRIEIGNDGWSWPVGSPTSDVQEFVGKKMWGRNLQGALIDRLSHQLRFGILVEQLPEPYNRVTIDPRYKDQLGNFRPVIHFDVGDYSRGGFELARTVSNQIFAMSDVEDCTTNFPEMPGFTYNANFYNYQGAGHYMGGHRMGSDPRTSVVNADLRSWDHENLYVVGCGSMTTSGTSNPTLTGAALSFLAADRIHQALGTNQIIAGASA